jgi:hypothetical protein
MFEWLEREIAAVRTPRFHVVDGPAKEELSEIVFQSVLPVPVSYMQFVLKFGNAKLYRDARHDRYEVGVFAAPRLSILEDGTRLYHIGFHDSASVYIKAEENLETRQIYEYEAGEEDCVAADFEEWIVESCERARKKFDETEWAKILLGPPPFSAREEEVINARRSIRWREKGIDPEGNHVIEVTNSGTRQLPVLKVGVRSKDGRLNGATLLKIGTLGPGETAVLHVECYKGLRKPEDLELFSLPDPQPEDRLLYPELAEM